MLGLAGLLGAGRTELARLLFGADTCKEGTIEIEGKPVKSILREMQFQTELLSAQRTEK